MCASTNNRDSTTHSTFQAGGLTNAVDSSIAHTPWKKGNKLKRKREWERKDRQNESEIQKSKVGGKIVAKQAMILILSSSLTYSMLCISLLLLFPT